MASQAILSDQQLKVLKELSLIKDLARKEAGPPPFRASVKELGVYEDYIVKQGYAFGPSGVVGMDSEKKSVTMHPLCFLGRGHTLKAFIDVIDEQSLGLSRYVVELDSTKNDGMFSANNHSSGRLGKVACRCNLRIANHVPTCLCAKALVYWNVDTLSQWSYVDVTNFLLKEEGRVIFFARLRMDTANGSFPPVPHGNILHEVSWVTLDGVMQVTLSDKGQNKIFPEVPYHFVYNPPHTHVVHSAQGLAILTGKSIFYNGVYDIIMLTASTEASIVVSSLSTDTLDEPKLVPKVSCISEAKNTILRLGDTPAVTSVVMKKLAGEMKEEESILATLSLAKQAATYEVNLNSKNVSKYFNERSLGGMIANGWAKWLNEIIGNANIKVRVVGFKMYRLMPEVFGVITSHFIVDHVIEQGKIVANCHDVYGVSRLQRHYIWYTCHDRTWLSYLYWVHKETPHVDFGFMGSWDSLLQYAVYQLNSKLLAIQWFAESRFEDKLQYYLTYEEQVTTTKISYTWGQILVMLWFVVRITQFSFDNIVVAQEAMAVYYKPAINWSWLKGWTVTDTLFADAPKIQVSLVTEVDDFYASETGPFEPYLVYKTNTTGFPETMPLREGCKLKQPKGFKADKMKVGFAVLGIQLLPLPMMHSGEVQNQGLALAGRLCKPCKFKTDSNFVNNEFETTLNNLDKFFGVVDFYQVAMDAKVGFNSWLKTFSKSKAKIYLSGYDCHSPSSEDAASGMLVKCELLNKAVETKMPRAIISSTPAYNRITGPEMATIYLFMKAVWNIDANVYIAGGTETAETYGARFEKLFDEMKYQTIDGDFTDYDASQKEEVFTFLRAVYYRIGMGHQALSLMEEKVVKIGYSTDGWRFEVDAGRGSGETDTLVGNCILTAHMMFSSLAAHKGIDLQELYDLLPRPRNTMNDVNTIIGDICNHIETATSDKFGVLACESDYDNNEEYFKDVIKFNTVCTVSEAMLRNNIQWQSHHWFFLDVLGDDNLTYLPPDVVVDPIKFELASNKYGMQNNATLTKDPSIMSSRFWLVDGHRILGPRPGRIIPKLACLSKPYSYVGGDQMDLLEGIAMKALGCKTDSLFIPILREVVNKVYYLGGSEKVGLQKHQFKAHAAREHVCHQDTMLQFCELYSLTVDRVLEIEDTIKSIDSLPYRIVSHDLETMYQVDN